MTDDCTTRWGVVAVASSHELAFAARAAERSPLTFYAPVRHESVWVSRLRRYVRRARAILPGYVLVDTTTRVVTDEELAQIHPTGYVRLIRSRAGTPARVALGEVQALRDAEASGELDQDPRDFALQFKAGHVFVVRQGILAGLSVMCLRDARRGADRADFLLNNRRTSVPLYLFGEVGY